MVHNEVIVGQINDKIGHEWFYTIQLLCDFIDRLSNISIQNLQVLRKKSCMQNISGCDFTRILNSFTFCVLTIHMHFKSLHMVFVIHRRPERHIFHMYLDCYF